MRVAGGAAQILDAAKEFLPQTKNRRNASDFVGIMETIVIDARFDWYSIFTGKFEADEIMDRWRKLARLMTETEGKYFPDGLPANSERQRLAEEEARAYFANIYGVGGGENGWRNFEQRPARDRPCGWPGEKYIDRQPAIVNPYAERCDPSATVQQTCASAGWCQNLGYNRGAAE